MIGINTKIQPGLASRTPHPSKNFRRNLSTTFWVTLLTDRQTASKTIPLLAEVTDLYNCYGLSVIWLSALAHDGDPSDSVMWSETVGLRTRPVGDQKKSVLVLHTVVLVLLLVLKIWCCVANNTRSSSKTKTTVCKTKTDFFGHARRHNDLEGHSSFSSTIYSFSILVLEHHYYGDQEWRSLT